MLQPEGRGIPPKQPHNRLTHNHTRLGNPVLRRITRVLHHLEQRAIGQLDGVSFTAFFLVEVATYSVDVVGESGCAE